MIYRFLIAFILLVTVAGCKDRIKEEPVTSPESPREIDKIRLTDLNGQAINLQQYQGKTIFINFWATWCKPCINEMPSVVEAQKLLQSEKIIFLMASGESAEEIVEFKNSYDYNFNYVRIENSEEINVQALPTTFIFNPQGKLVFSETGAREWNEKSNIDLILKIANANE